MITEVQFLDVFSAKALRPAPDLAVISMLGAQEETHRPLFAGFDETRLLRLRFDDVVYVLSREHLLNGPTMDHARQIHGFISALHQSARQVRLVAHCFGGVSRSAAVALHAGQLADIVPVQVQDKPHAAFAANERLLGMLRAAAKGADYEDDAWLDFGHPDSFIGAQRADGI